jgi:transposase
MARFKHTNNSQGLFLPVYLSEQLLPGTFEWALNYLIDKMDLSLFEQNYHNDEMGAAAYSPKALLKIIFYCYSTGILSSRPMEKACKANITVKALAENSEPDHDTIAAFISTNSKAVKDLFTQALMQCYQLELITGEMFALDGCKLPSNASKEWSGTIAGLKKKKERLEKHITRLLLRHRELDKSEEAKKIQKPYQKTMGDERERRERSIERLEKKLKKLNAFLKTAEPKKGTSGEEVQSNITDNESAKLKGPHGYIQGYNGIAVADSGNQIIASAEAAGSSESGNFSNMLESLEENMKTITGKDKLLKKTLCLADTGFFSEGNLQEAAGKGIGVLIPDPQFRQRDPDFQEGRKEKAKKRFD